jgi:hypothetical protein
VVSVFDPHVAIVGRDGKPIKSLRDWFQHAPPAGSRRQWVDGYSAKESAKAWLCRQGHPAVPAEILAALRAAGTSDIQSMIVRPELETRLDGFGPRGKGNRNHDVLAIGTRSTGGKVVIGIEAKACEDFDGVVGTRAVTSGRSNKPARLNLLSRALFGQDVCDVEKRVVLNADLASHGYQLWTAAVGTLIEADKHQAEMAVFIVHQFFPDPLDAPPPGDRRDWATALANNDEAFTSFVAALAEGDATSHKTEFVRGGIPLRVHKAIGPLGPAANAITD